MWPFTVTQWVEVGLLMLLPRNSEAVFRGDKSPLNWGRMGQVGPLCATPNVFRKRQRDGDDLDAEENLTYKNLWIGQTFQRSLRPVPCFQGQAGWKPYTPQRWLWKNNPQVSHQAEVLLMGATKSLFKLIEIIIVIDIVLSLMTIYFLQLPQYIRHYPLLNSHIYLTVPGLSCMQQSRSLVVACGF